MKASKFYEIPIREHPSSGENFSLLHRYQQEFDNKFYTGLGHDLSVASVDFETDNSAYPGISCVTPGNPYVLHCFPPFKTELTKEQHDHLDIIARIIRRSFTTSRPITKVVIIGHSSTWHKSSRESLESFALQRAGTAGEQLILRLHRMGIAKQVDIDTDGRSDTVRWRGKPYSSTSGSKKAQGERALNRRVEIRLIKGKKSKPKPKIHCELAEALKKIDFTLAARAKNLMSLQNILVLGLCGKVVDDRFWTFSGSDALGTKTVCLFKKVPGAGAGSKFIPVKPYRWHNRPAVFLDRNIKPLRIINLFKKELGTSRDPKKIRSIVLWLEQAMNCNIEMLGQYIELNCDIGPSGFKKDTNCVFVHYAYKLATNRRRPSIYQCFLRELKEYKAVCSKGCSS